MKLQTLHQKSQIQEEILQQRTNRLQADQKYIQAEAEVQAEGRSYDSVMALNSEKNWIMDINIRYLKLHLYNKYIFPT